MGNRITEAWNRGQERINQHKDDPDSLTIDGMTVEFPKENEMALVADGQPKAMLPHQYDNIIRSIKRSAFDSVGLMEGATARTMERLSVKPQPAKAVKGIPDGSNDVNASPLLVWMEKLTIDDKKTRDGKKAIRQLVAINATAKARLEL